MTDSHPLLPGLFRALPPLVVATLAACGGGDRPVPADSVAMPAATEPSVPADSLVLSTPLGEVWFTHARRSADAAGTPCWERTLEIRRDTAAVVVPLLYTGAAPTLSDDTTLRASLWLHCLPAVNYDIDFRTGTPTRAGQ